MSGVLFEFIEHDGVRYAEVIRASSETPKSTFMSPDASSMQFGLLAHGAGYVEPPHTHQAVTRTISNLSQMFVVQRGKVAIDFFTPEGKKFRDVTLGVGDAILLVDGAHSLRVLEDMQCVSVKQGPFLGMENDKIEIRVTE